MISFFRKIRQSLLEANTVTRYLGYAIGEIVLVVIGILIALQINNSNEARKARINEQAVLKNLVQDLRADSLSFQDNLITLAKINKLHQVLYEIGVKGMDLEVENPNAIRLLIYYNPIAIKNDPFVADKISNEAIRKEITTYSRYLKDLDITYLEYAELLEKRIRVYLADKKALQLSSWFESTDNSVKGGTPFDFVNREELILLSKTPEFQQLLLEVSIKTKNTQSNIETVLTQNQTLKEVILKELEK
ncbi:DUF6090 family protein [Algoriphagus marinus]|uniref:DUF6090 family protein n=1 Tax=Algoriphagus marinus TaxID=1925762 RepID=UPI00094BB91E|nr:DUF6090 family protein [Algoriphagus marinus]